MSAGGRSRLLIHSPKEIRLGDPVHVGTKYSSSTENPPENHKDTGTSSTDTGTGTGTTTETGKDRAEATEHNPMPEFMTRHIVRLLRLNRFIYDSPRTNVGIGR